MKALITYSSKTGNTKKLIEEAHKLIGSDYKVDVTTIKEANGYDEYDLIIPAFWIDKGTANSEAKKFIKKIKNKNVIFLATLGASPDSSHADDVRNKVPELLDESNNYMGIFLARGKVDEKLIKKIKLLPLPKNLKDEMYEASINSREPNEEEFKGTAEFIKNTIESLK